MNRHRAAPLSYEDSLALFCSVGRPGEAQRAWLELMSIISFDEVSENTQRLMPAIYWNLREAMDLPERDRMRGAFKHAWAKNTHMLHDLLPTLNALHEAGINYRLVKGLAVQLLGRGLGSRSMGDIDLLVAAADMQHAEELLLSMGFRRNTLSVCDRHPRLAGEGAVNFNLRDSHVDVHAAEHKFPAVLLTRMLSEPPRRVGFGRHALLIPSAELLVLHASVHGGQAVSPTDFVQAACDVAALAPAIDAVALLRLARATQTLGPLMSMDAALEAAGIVSSGVRPGVVGQWVARLHTGTTASHEGVRKAMRARQLIDERRLDQQAIHEVKRDFGASSRRYRTWLQLGRFSAAERALFRTSGKFLPKPTSTWPKGQVARVFSDTEVKGVVASRVASRAMDWRFRVRFARDPRAIHVRLDAADMEHIDAYVYCNGVPVTRVVAGDEGSRQFTIMRPGSDIEVSLRPTWAACGQCYPGYNDLLVTIEIDAEERARTDS